MKAMLQAGRRQSLGLKPSEQKGQGNRIHRALNQKECLSPH